MLVNSQQSQSYVRLGRVGLSSSPATLSRSALLDDSRHSAEYGHWVYSLFPPCAGFVLFMGVSFFHNCLGFKQSDFFYSDSENE